MAQLRQRNDDSSLAETVNRILDKGIVVDAWVSVALVGVELLSIRARVLIASAETYLAYADRIARTEAAAAPPEEGKARLPAEAPVAV